MPRGWDSDPSPTPMPAPSLYPLDGARPQARQTSPHTQEPRRDFKAPAPQFSGDETKAQGGADAGPGQPSEAPSETERVCVLPEGCARLWARDCLPATHEAELSRRGSLGPLLSRTLSLLPALTTARPGLGERTLLFSPPIQTDGETEAQKQRAWRELATRPVPLPRLELAPSLKSRRCHLIHHGPDDTS